MAIFKRGRIYYADISIKGERVIRSLQTTDRTQAQEAHDKIRAELWRVIALGETPTVKELALSDAVSQYIKDAERRDVKDTYTIDKQLQFFVEQLGKKILVSNITKDDITDVIRAKINEGARRKGAGRHEVSNATLNRYISAMSGLLNYCKEHGNITGEVPKVPLFPERKRRVRFLTPEQAERLLSVLPDGVIKLMVRFSLATGLRQANVTHLEWSRVDMGKRIAWIEADQAKGKKLIPIQLSDEALEILKGQDGKHPLWVFPAKGSKPMGDPAEKTWAKALREAEITNFRWHDLRHTWASWHVQNGTPLPVLQELGGWSSYAMVQKYAHLAPSHLAQYANNASYKSATVENSEAQDAA